MILLHLCSFPRFGVNPAIVLFSRMSTGKSGPQRPAEDKKEVKGSAEEQEAIEDAMEGGAQGEIASRKRKRDERAGRSGEERVEEGNGGDVVKEAAGASESKHMKNL